MPINPISRKPQEGTLDKILKGLQVAQGLFQIPVEWEKLQSLQRQEEQQNKLNTLAIQQKERELEQAKQADAMTAQRRDNKSPITINAQKQYESILGVKVDPNLSLDALEGQYGKLSELQQTKFKSDLEKRNKAAEKRTETTNKTIPAGEVVNATGGATAMKILEDVGTSISQSGDLLGPVAGRLAGVNPYNKDAQTLNAQLKVAAQKIGTYLEGGKLAEGDIKRYQSMLPALSDTPDVAANKIEVLKRLIAQKQESDNASLSGSGYNTAGLPKPGAIPEVPKRTGGERTVLSIPKAHAGQVGKLNAEDMQALEWAKQNLEKDPRAKQIMERINLKLGAAGSR